MSLIVWRPVMDEADKARFPYSGYPDTVSEAGWTGRDMYDQEPLYVLELLASNKSGEDDIKRFAIISKFVSAGDPTRKWLLNVLEPTDDDIADAAGHMGFKYFRRELTPRGLTLIHEER